MNDSTAITRFSKIVNNSLPLYFDDFFGIFMRQEQLFEVFFVNFLPLSPTEYDTLTFLQ